MRKSEAVLLILMSCGLLAPGCWERAANHDRTDDADVIPRRLPALLNGGDAVTAVDVEDGRPNDGGVLTNPQKAKPPRKTPG